MAYGKPADEAMRALVQRVSPSIVSIVPHDDGYGPLTEGSGFFVAEGRVITSRHILEGSTGARVHRGENEVYEVLGVLAEDPASDLAMLAVDIPDKTAPLLRLAKKEPRSGERCAAVAGRMAPEKEGVEGIASWIRDLPLLGRIIRTTCPVNPGASGCPLVGMDGDVLGMIVARDLDGETLLYAVPAARIDDLVAEGFVKLTDRVEADSRDPTRYLPGLRALLEEDFDGAVSAFRAVVDADSRALPAWEALAGVLVHLGRAREAMEAARVAADLDPENPGPWAVLGLAAGANGLPLEAVEACRRVVRLRPDDARSHNRLGVACYDSGQFEEAAAAFREAIRLNPDYAQEHKNLGVACFALGRNKEAADAFREAVRLKPDFHRAWKDLGMACYNMGDYEQAAEASREAVRLKPGMARAHNNLGVAYQALGRTGEAVEAYREALRLRPGFGQASSNLAYALLKSGRAEEALEAFRNAVQHNPGDAEARTSLALLLRRMGRGGEAMEELTEAVRINPGHAGAHFHLGVLHVEGGNKGAALDQYKVLKGLDEERAKELFGQVYR